MVKCGIDIGGTNIKFGFFDMNNNLILEKSIPTSQNQEEIIKDIIETVKKSYDIKDILGYSVAIPGVCENNICVYAPNTNIVGLNFYEELSIAFENQNIIIDNDANLAALAEAKLTNTKDLIMITLGTGVGGGIVIDGNIYNKNGFAGEIGHIKVNLTKYARLCGCGQKGCLEAYASARTICKTYEEKTKRQITSFKLFDLWHKSKLCELSINIGAKSLGIAIANITTTLAIKEIRISGGLINVGTEFLELIRKYYKEYCLPSLSNVNINYASLGSKAGIYACKYLI
jgi:glucokinase